MKKLIFCLFVFSLCLSKAIANENIEILNIFTKNECISCHIDQSHASSSKTKQISQKDMELGLRYFEMWRMYRNLQLGNNIPESSLAMLLAGLKEDGLSHQQTENIKAKRGLSEKEQQKIQAWVIKESQKYYKNIEMADEFKGDFIRPIPDRLEVNGAKANLGEKLFHNPKLSFDNTVSCASCHKIWAGGDDGLNVSIGVNGLTGSINAPTVLNAVFNMAQFWDGRTVNLSEQASKPPLNPVEMASNSWGQVIEKLEADTLLKEEFDMIYDDGITADNIVDGIAEFEKTLITPNSRFDQYLKGDKTALSEEEKQGYQLFKKYNCNICHVGEAMGGQSFEYMGRKKDYFADRKRGKGFDDDGRLNITNHPSDRHKFKVPTLRNIALTAPYFHDAEAQTLKEAVEITLKYETAVRLDETEVNQIVAFLKSLTGEYKGKILKP